MLSQKNVDIKKEVKTKRYFQFLIEKMFARKINVLRLNIQLDCI